MLNNTDGSFAPQGWTQSPDGRGTMDIIWSCISTMSLCSWTILCINVGAPGDSSLRYIRYKLSLVGLCILIPDFLQYLAIGQWESACRSVNEFNNLGYTKWSMKHAFFADMGGFVVKTKDGLSWPLDSRELFYLIREGWITDPMISRQVMLDKKSIDDKNKKDTILRIITLSQALWFIINSSVRAYQGLTTTTLEITTLSIIATSITVLFFWAHKPADIRTPYELNIEASIHDIRRKAGFTLEGPFYRTPLDFLNPDESYCFSCWDYHLNILRCLRFLSHRNPAIITRRREDNFPSVSQRGNGVSLIIASISFALNLVAWNFRFPTTIERNMWRACSIATWAFLTLGWVYQLVLTNFYPKLKEHACIRFAAVRDGIMPTTSTKRPKPNGSMKEKITNKLRSLANRMRNISSNKDPALTVPLRVIIPCIFFGQIYSFARLYLIVEDLIAFRALPPDVYKTVAWPQYILHAG